MNFYEVEAAVEFGGRVMRGVGCGCMTWNLLRK